MQLDCTIISHISISFLDVKFYFGAGYTTLSLKRGSKEGKWILDSNFFRSDYASE